jgi:peptidoglycan/LPS O-acetylase OafA/YrhL
VSEHETGTAVSIRYNPGLDGLRAIAVFIVMAAHAGAPYVLSGGTGVDIFFVLSGYLITSILSAEAQSLGRISFRNFYARRFLRLAPCLAMVVGFYLITTLVLQHDLPLKNAAIALTYTANWVNALTGIDLGALDHCWSLATEEQYYLIWPIVISALERSGRTPLDKGLLLLGLAVLAAVYRFAMVGTFTAEHIYYGVDTHIDGLMLGSSLNYLLKSRLTTKFSENALLPSVIGLALMPHFLTWRSPLMGKYGLFATAVMAAVVVVTLVNSRDSALSRFLSVAPLVFLGRISYGLYLWHVPIFAVLTHFMPHAKFRIAFPVKISITIAVACASYYLVEVRFLALKRQFESSRQVSAVSSAAAAATPSSRAVPR